MIIETERLVLKVLDGSFADLVLEYFNRNREHLKQFDPLRSENFYKVENRKKALDQEILDIDNGTQLRLWIFKKTDIGFKKIIGTICFSHIVKGFFLSCYVGYSIDNSETNKGYITEVLKKGIDIMFREYNLHRIEGTVMPKNIASLKVLEKLNFKNEGLSTKYQKINGKWEDHIHMVLLNSEVE
ncbi:GNAT family N-acetyltransferase [Oceanirhabdus seepicola]|uniref:GNAT family N-acetyltransferase n=1 Tax=Oceanirhabdus seepicola TaxID=2828781 RepID=A0A9J6P6I5_9CLOT|nr:GNAT family protein [Oceanirhabdus seepicola]MCM1992195.1 GNAT family N-acetyltransferase [Oceanirhabdus seepicola]